MDPKFQMRLDRFDMVVADLQDHIDATAGKTRRHIDVVAEGLRGEIRLLSEGFTRIDRVEVALRAEIVRSRDALAALIRLLAASHTPIRPRS